MNTLTTHFSTLGQSLTHVLEGLPDTVVLRWDAHGRVVEVRRIAIHITTRESG